MPRIKGTEKAGGYSIKTVFIDPGAITAGTSIPLPSWAQGAQEIVQAVLFHGTTDVILDTGTADPTEAITLTVVTGAPTGNQIQLYDENNIRLGVDTRTNDFILLALRYKSFAVEV